MVIAFQIILLIIIFCSFVMISTEKDNKASQENFMFICAIAIAFFFASGMWL